MAGGPLAHTVACMECAGPAVRIYEGLEDDHYRCQGCGAQHGIDWSRGQPTEPTWPISVEEREAILRFAAQRRGG